MISKIFDSGWGGDLPIPQWHSEHLTRIAQSYTGNAKAIIVNSTWYTDDIHSEVVAYIKTNNIKNIILTSLCDAHIVRRELFEELEVNVFEIGYYRGPGFYDFFARCWDRFGNIKLSDTELLDHQTIHKPFMCLNRKHHEHRVKIVNELRSAGLTDKGIVTLSGTDLRLDEDFTDHKSYAPESGADIPNDIMSIGDPGIWSSHFLNVVTETWWDINQAYYASDKYFKPLTGLRPFFIWSEDMGVEWLTDRKFELYHDDFQDITDLDLRAHSNMIPFLKVLSDQPKTYLENKFIALREKLLYNRNRFNEYVQEQHLDTVIERMNKELR